MAKNIKPTSTRPMPAPEFDEPFGMLFKPAPDVYDWLLANILSADGPLYNPDHAHLIHAHIGILWTNCQNSRSMRRVIGQAEIPMCQGGKWKKARHDLQLIQWFGDVPDFLITLDATHCLQSTDAEFAALIEHELYHCAQALDRYGFPKFSKDTGLPLYAIKGHDVEEFVGVVRRYGVGQPDGPVANMVRAANKAPEIASTSIASACGTCMLQRA